MDDHIDILRQRINELRQQRDEAREDACALRLTIARLRYDNMLLKQQLLSHDTQAA